MKLLPNKIKLQIKNLPANKIKLLQITPNRACCCKLKHQKCARALEEGGVGTRSFLFLSGKLLYFFLGLWDYSDKFPKMFCSSSRMECPSTANLCHQCGQQLTLSQVSNKASSSVDKENC